VVLACGCEQPRDVEVPGRGCRGIHFALAYLSQQNHRVAGDLIEPEAAIVARDKDVVVIGGGDTGCDCVGTAIRQGARQVTQVQYHEQPPQQADVLNYWPKPVPVMRRVDTEAEGCRRIWGWDTVRFEYRQDRVEGVRLQRLEWTRRADGSWEKWHLHGQDLCLPAQLVLVATGYAHPVHEGLLEQAELAYDARGNLAASDTDYRSSETGVFACGDVRRGQSLVVWAIREGRQCAQSVDSWLSGHSDLPRV
jgi:glutamate synthase (NADPH/NADH) small chain